MIKGQIITTTHILHPCYDEIPLYVYSHCIYVWKLMYHILKSTILQVLCSGLFKKELIDVTSVLISWFLSLVRAAVRPERGETLSTHEEASNNTTTAQNTQGRWIPLTPDKVLTISFINI